MPRIPRSVYILTGCVGVVGANSLMLGPIAPEVSRSFDASVAIVMMATAVFGFGAALSSLFFAPRIDRFGAHRMLRLAMTLLPLALLVSAAAPGVAILVAAQFVAGLASGVALPAVYASAASMAPPGLESKAIGKVLSGWLLSMVAGVSLSAIVADLAHWRAVYGLLAVLAVAMLLFLMRVRSRDAVSTTQSPTPLSALCLKGIKPLLFAVCVLMVSFYGVYAYLGDYFHSGLNQPISANGLITLAYSMGFGGAILMGGIVTRVGVRRVLTSALFFVAMVYALMAWFGAGLPSMLLLLLLLGLGNYFGINLLIVSLTSIDPAKRGTIMGLHGTVTNLAVFAGTSGFGKIYAASGFAAIAYAAAALSLAAAVASLSAR